MKALFRTSMIVVAAIGILALSAVTAQAAPGDFYAPGMQIDPETMAALQSLIDNGQLDPAADLGDDENVVPPDNLGDDENIVPGDGGDDEMVPPGDGENDVPDNPGEFDNPDTPGTSEDTPTTGAGETPQTPETPRIPETRLPNTGTQLVIIAGLGLLVAVGAMGIRRYAVRHAH